MQRKIFAIIFALILMLVMMSGCTENTADNNQNPEDTTNDDENTEDTADNNDNTDANDEEEPATDQEPEETYDENLLAYYKFDESTGTTTKEEIGSYDGTIYGNAEFKTGKKGNALYFDGTDDYVKLPQTAIDQIGSLTSGSISIWFKYTSILDSQVIMPIFYIGNEDNTDDDSLFIIEIGHFDTENPGPGSLDPTDKKLYSTWVDVTKEQNPFLCFDSNVNLEEDTWHHFVLVVDSNGNTGYLNGVELTDRRYNFGSSSDQKFLNDIPVKELLCIGYGKSHSDVGTEFLYFKGYVDELQIYNKALSSSEIQELYNI